jgi:hypothetical protein
MFGSFVELVDSLPEHERLFCNDACQQRYLRAHKNNVANAVRGLYETILWRREYQPDKITLEDVASEGLANNTFTNGFDRKGRPIIYVKKRGVLGDPVKNVRLLVYVLESAIKLMKNDVDRWIIVFDFQEYSRANSPPLNISKQTLDILSKHYPERLGCAFFTFTPWIFGIFWSVFSRFVDPITSKKIHFIGEDMNHLLELIDVDQLEKKYGGTLDFDFASDAPLKFGDSSITLPIQ